MNIQYFHLENFASYKQLDFSTTDQGLVLIHGATGSGKSTLFDAAAWILFGKTAKGGAVDEVISWQGGPTTGTIIVQSGLTVTRVRGPGKNDLWFSTADNQTPVRGKDLQDTQKLINSMLGIDYELYLSGAYFHEFSQTAQFFTTTAKQRRAFCEQLVDLSLPKTLQEKTAILTKDTTKQLAKVESEIYNLEAKLVSLQNYRKQESAKLTAWETNKASRVAQLEARILWYEETRTRKIAEVIEAATRKAKSMVCSECGAPKTQETHRHHDNSIDIKKIEAEINPYLEQFEAVLAEVNPHSAGTKDFTAEINAVNTELTSKINAKTVLTYDNTTAEMLSDILVNFRNQLIKNTIADLEAKTNRLLSECFDAELQVTLSVEESDKLETSITKDGYECSFTQLSKGQRQILKLCFAVATMECIGNHHGTQFKQLFFDEATDGMDETNKIKALKMLDTLTLNHDTVFLVEHSSEIKAAVTTKYKVELVNGKSEIKKEA